MTLRPTIDRAWIERAADREPLAHAYALWDLLRQPERVRFVSAVRGDETVGYLLIWLGRPDWPVVHWFGDPAEAAVLREALPRPPFVAVVPPEAEAIVVGSFPEARRYPLLMLWREHGPSAVEAGPVRPLARSDRPLLEAWSRAHDEPMLAEYAGVDPGVEPTWGAFEGERLVGVARAAVRLPRVWVVGGVYIDRPARGRGLGRRLVAAAIDAAEAGGAHVGLFVREDQGPAVGMYERLGFRTVGRRAWLDVGARLEP